MHPLRILKKLLPVLLFLSCTSVDETKDKRETVIKNVDTIAAEFSAIDTMKKEFPAMIYFKQADCHGAEEEKLVRKKLKNDTLLVEMDLVKDCGTKYAGSFKLNGDTLDIGLKLLPSQIIQHKNGKIDSIYTIQECYCIYKFLIRINHVEQMPGVVLVNGSKIRKGFYK